MTHRHRLTYLALGTARRRRAAEIALALELARKRLAEVEAAEALLTAALAKKALDALIVAAMPMVRRNASSIAVLMPARIDQGDLVDAGYVALVEASRDFDVSRGVKLATYARLRVRGAMWDLVRRRNWVEMSHLELKPELLEMPDERQAPESMLEAARKKAAAQEAMRCLDGRERMVVERYYGGEELVQIGRDIGLCKQTMTNIHRRALGKMQEHFRLRGIKAA